MDVALLRPPTDTARAARNRPHGRRRHAEIRAGQLRRRRRPHAAARRAGARRGALRRGALAVAAVHAGALLAAHRPPRRLRVAPSTRRVRQLSLNGTMRELPELANIEFNVNLPALATKPAHATVAQLLAQHGIPSGLVGKWHLGYPPSTVNSSERTFVQSARMPRQWNAVKPLVLREYKSAGARARRRLCLRRAALRQQSVPGAARAARRDAPPQCRVDRRGRLQVC